MRSRVIFHPKHKNGGCDTVGGRNPEKPVEVGSFSHYLQGFSTIPGGDRRISEPTVMRIGKIL